METTYVVVLITAPSKETAQVIARHLVENKLAACVNSIAPIESVYAWKGEIQQDSEVLLIAKTQSKLVEEGLIPAVKAIHPYDIPEIIALPIQAGSKDYFGWIRDVTLPV